ncbi:MAG: glycosyltransferase family 9 protein [Chitinophagaceae bacterium]
MKFLIIRFSSIGDIVLTTPVVRCLKQQVKNSEVHYLIKKNYKEIIESNPYVDKIHCLIDDWKKLIDELKQEKFDYIIDLHHNLRSWRVKNALKKIPSFSFNKLNFEKWLMTVFKIDILPKIHIVDRYLETLKNFDVRNDEKGLDYFISEKDIVPVDHLPASHQMGFIGIVIGAAHNTKKLPLHKLKELCSKINHPIILLGGKEDKINGDEITAVDSIKIYNACGKFSLNESADLVQKSKLIISHDTGLMHVAAAFQKPIISVWGNTIPQFGMAPYYGNLKSEIGNLKSEIFEIKNLWCRPCSKIGYKKCPLGHFKCMELQDMDSITQTIKSFSK